MKQTLLRLLWIFIFFAVGMVVLDFLIRDVMPWSFHDDDATFFHKVMITAPVGLICLVGLPMSTTPLGAAFARWNMRIHAETMLPNTSLEPMAVTPAVQIYGSMTTFLDAR